MNKIKSDLKIAYPFLDRDGKINTNRYKQFRSTIEVGRQRTMGLAHYLNDRSQQFAIAEQLIESLLGVIQEYELRNYTQTPQDCASLIQNGWLNVDSINHITPGVKYNKRTPFLYGRLLADGSCAYRYGSYDNSSRSRLIGLLGDYYEHYTQFFANSDSHYATLDHYRLYAEIGSTYQIYLRKLEK
ncbi:MAG: hypothetical protein M3R00_10540 [Pseudomonadota bacterium]|nr:hypothetical protein [Pseudomonadota bacterium]